MNDQITGGCLCGEVRYKVSLKGKSAVYCHCKDCQKATGGAFSFSLPVEMENLVLMSGEIRSYEKIADSGNKIVRNFCPNCSSIIFTGDRQSSPLLWIQSGTLDNPEIVKPLFQIWVKSRLSWSSINSDLKGYEKNPH